MRRLNEATLAIHKMLLERFGEPISQTTLMVGAADEGPGGKKIWTDEPLDREWSDGDVVKEAQACHQCGMMPNEMDEGCPQGHMDETDAGPRVRTWFVYNAETGTDVGEYEAVSREDAIRQFKADLDPGEELDPNITADVRDEYDGWKLDEARASIAPEEVLQTWEDLYIEMQEVPLDVLASWLAADEETVMKALPRNLVVDKDGNVVEKGLSSRPPPEAVRPSQYPSVKKTG